MSNRTGSLIMSKIIIGIHGMGNKPDAAQLKKWWKAAIREGFRGLDRYRPMNFEMVYWASFLHKNPLLLNCKDPEHPQFLKEPFIKGLEHPFYHSENDLALRIREKINAQIDRIFLDENGNQNFNTFSDFIIRHFVKDLAAYYQESGSPEESVKEQICLQLSKRLTKNRRKKILLIAHSMGSIIAWDVLTKYVPQVKIHTFVTIGSPLGIPVVRSKILRDLSLGMDGPVLLKSPENIEKAWYNLADFKDKVAINHDIMDNYLPNSSGIRPEDVLVLNSYRAGDRENHHKSYGYLGSPEMTEIVLNFYRNA